MATSIAAGSGSLHYGLIKRQGCRQASRIPSVTFNGCLQRELSWCNLYASSVSENWKSLKTVSISSCLRDGSTEYFDFTVIGSGVAGLRYALEVAKHGSVVLCLPQSKEVQCLLLR